MDPVTLGAVLLAVMTGASEALSGQLWERLTSLVRRPSRRKAAAGHKEPSGGAELAALLQRPGEPQAVALAEALLARASTDGDFRQALAGWWEQAEPVRATIGTVTNTVSGGTQQGPVLQGRDFSGLTFNAPPARPPEDPGSSS